MTVALRQCIGFPLAGLAFPEGSRAVVPVSHISIERYTAMLRLSPEAFRTPTRVVEVTISLRAVGYHDPPSARD